MEIAEVPAYIKENILEDLSVKFFARSCYTCQTNFKIRFKQAFGETIGRYIIRIKMYKAAEMLTSGEYKNVSDVGRQIGYINISNFCKAYKNFYGHLPSEVHIKPQRKDVVNEKDIHASQDVLMHQVITCPENLRNQFQRHFGKSIVSFLKETAA